MGASVVGGTTIGLGVGTVVGGDVWVGVTWGGAVVSTGVGAGVTTAGDAAGASVTVKTVVAYDGPYDAEPSKVALIW